MLTEQLLHGLKNYFKEENLSDRILQIVEIDEDFTDLKRKRDVESSVPNEELSNKRLKTAENQADISEGAGCSSSKNNSDVDRLGCSTSALTSNAEEGKNDTLLEQELIAAENIEIGTAPFEPSTLMEVQNTESSDSPQKEEVYSTFPVHSIVLCINSNFFKKLLVESGMKETSMKTVTVKVNHGEGKYLEKVIEAFYNQDVLKDSSLTELLHILGIAARFSCTAFIKHGLENLNDKQISSVDECDSILQHISRVFEVFDNEGKYVAIKNSCLKYLATKFYPLEFKLSEQNAFKRLNHVTIVYLLNSNQAFTINENHSLLFIYEWLIHNTDHQTPSVIKLFLSNIRYEALSSTFLCDHLHISDKILSIWPGYSVWYTNALKYHALTPNQRNLRDMKNKPINIRFVTSLDNSLLARKHFVYDRENDVFCDRSKNFIVWSGLQLCLVPSLRHSTQDGASHLIRLKILAMSAFDPGTHFDNFHQKFDIYYCLLPGNVSFKLSMLDCKRFIQRYIRKTEVCFKCKSAFNLHTISKVDDGFVESIQNFGINLVLFFKNSVYSWNSIENIKSAKKLINLKEDKFLSEF